MAVAFGEPLLLRRARGDDDDDDDGAEAEADGGHARTGDAAMFGPLEAAASANSVACLSALVARGVQARDQPEVLHAAATFGALAAVRWLVESAGADVEHARRGDGCTPLLVAVKRACVAGEQDDDESIAACDDAIRVVEYLCETAECDVNARSAAGLSALQIATLEPSSGVRCVQPLLRSGAVPDEEIATSLLLCASGAHEDTLRAILASRAPSLRLGAGEWLTTVACAVGMRECVAAEGRVYFEVLLHRVGIQPQVGWMARGAAPEDAACGIGDDAGSWAANGVDGLLWHDAHQEEYGTAADEWTDGDVVGVAADLSEGSVWFGHNGAWRRGFEASEPSALRVKSSGGLFPALSGGGMHFSFNLGDAPMRHAGPTADFVPLQQQLWSALASPRVLADPSAHGASGWGAHPLLAYDSPLLLQTRISLADVARVEEHFSHRDEGE